MPLQDGGQDQQGLARKASSKRTKLKPQCTPADYRRVRRWEHEALLDAMQRRLDRRPDAMTLRRRTIEHVFGTLKYGMGLDPLPHPRARACRPGNEPACTRLHPEACQSRSWAWQRR